MVASVFEYVSRTFDPFLADDAVTDIVVNRPHEIGVEKAGSWEWHAAPDLTFDRLDAIGILAAFHAGEDITQSYPVCTATLPHGERINVCRPPASDDGTISLSIRRPPGFEPSVELLKQKGMFASPDTREAEIHLGMMEVADDLAQRIIAAVLAKKNILIGGATGSGKTTLARALIRCIPEYERLVTIEDTREWRNLPQRNWVPLRYSKAGQGASKLTSEDMVQTSLRMRPDRVLIGELRDEAAFSYMHACVAGHPGGITTLHAGSAKGAFDALRLMVRQSKFSIGLPDEDVREMLHDRVDMVLHCRHEPPKRYWVDDVYERTN